MATLTILGTASAIPDPEHANTHFAVQTAKRMVLVDTAADPLVRLPEAGLELLQLNDLILTHLHPDHISGVPLLLMDSWLLGRKNSLHIHGLASTLEMVEQMMNLYGWGSWPGFYPVHFKVLPEREMALVLEDEDLRVLSSPVKHLVPTIGLRFESKQTGKVIAYSCDTEPSQAVVHLAEGAGMLLHEATGASKGHSSAEGAAQVAQQAAVSELLLIHYPPQDGNMQTRLREAEAAFNGPVALAQDFQRIEF